MKWAANKAQTQLKCRLATLTTVPSLQPCQATHMLAADRAMGMLFSGGKSYRLQPLLLPCTQFWAYNKK